MVVGGPSSKDAENRHFKWATSELKSICARYPEFRFLIGTSSHTLHDSVRSTLRIIRQVDQKNLHICLNVSDLFGAEEDPITALRYLYPHIDGVKVKAERFSGISSNTAGSGTEVDYVSLFETLGTIGFRGYVGVEALKVQDEDRIRSEFVILRDLIEKAVTRV